MARAPYMSLVLGNRTADATATPPRERADQISVKKAGQALWDASFTQYTARRDSGQPFFHAHVKLEDGNSYGGRVLLSVVDSDGFVLEQGALGGDDAAGFLGLERIEHLPYFDYVFTLEPSEADGRHAVRINLYP